MFSLNRRLSSRSSWVMWHHFSLWAQEGQDGLQNGLGPSLPCSVELVVCTGSWTHGDLAWGYLPPEAATCLGIPKTSIYSLPKMKNHKDNNTLVCWRPGRFLVLKTWST